MLLTHCLFSNRDIRQTLALLGKIAKSRRCRFYQTSCLMMLRLFKVVQQLSWSRHFCFTNMCRTSTFRFIDTGLTRNRQIIRITILAVYISYISDAFKMSIFISYWPTIKNLQRVKNFYSLCLTVNTLSSKLETNNRNIILSVRNKYFKHN